MMQKFTEFCLARRASLFGFKNKKTTVSEEIDLASATFFQNPYPTYQRLRKTSPIVAVKPAGHLLTRHADIAEALASPDLRNTPSRFSVLNSRNAKRYEAARLANNILPFLDPPENKVRRQCLIRAVHSRLNQWQTGIDAVADKQMQTFLRDKGDDLIEDFSSPLSLGLMCDFIGIPESEKQRYKQLSEAFFYLFAPISNAEKFEQVNEVLAVFRTEFQGLLDKRVLEPKPDLISALLVAEEEGEKLDHDEMVDSCMLVFADGVENVEAGIANVLSAFHQDKQAQKQYHDRQRRQPRKPHQIEAEPVNQPDTRRRSLQGRDGLKGQRTQRDHIAALCIITHSRCHQFAQGLHRGLGPRAPLHDAIAIRRAHPVNQDRHSQTPDRPRTTMDLAAGLADLV